MDGVQTANRLFDSGESNAERICISIHIFQLWVVKGPQEAILDSRFFVMATNMGAQKGRALKSGSGKFDVGDFVTRLVRYMGGQNSFENGASEGSDSDDDHHLGPALDWDRIGRKSMDKSRRVPVTGFMYVLYMYYFHVWVADLTLPCQARSLIRRTKKESSEKSVKT